MPNQTKPVVVITGAAGNIGTALINALRDQYTIVGLDRSETKAADASFEFDLTSRQSVVDALKKVSEQFGNHLAAVIHLAAYFDFSGEHSPLYDSVNVQGTRNLLSALQRFQLDRFIYSSTMLVHKPGTPGEKTTEETPLQPKWAYPESKLKTEQVIQQEATMPYTLLRLAGLYDEQSAVPTLSHQIARIYEKNLKSHLYSGDINAGQAFVHREDMIEAFKLTVEKRKDLPEKNSILIGEERSASYDYLQDRLGELIHGEDEWQTLRVPSPIAKAGAWVEEKAEPIIPDDFDHGEKPFIRPFMIDMASDHYELDCSKAHKLLGWTARHFIGDALAGMVANLKSDPLKWYKSNKLTPADWMTAANEKHRNPDELRSRYNRHCRNEHSQFLWAHFLTIGLGVWLLSSPPVLGYMGTAIALSDYLCGFGLVVFGLFALSWRHQWARWVNGTIGLWLLLAPLAFWTPSAAAYLNSTLIGILVIGFAMLTRPNPGVSPVAAMTGPSTPPGWDVNPSSWFQRAPIIILAFVGFFISRYLTAYQLEHIDGVWEPFFSGSAADPQNGTEEIITSSVSEAWPVPDAGLGAMTYALEILTGLMGSTKRWRTMPWLVVLFGFMIVPLGIVSITFIIIQPIVIGTWCTLCLIGAAAMLIQIPYSLDELVATGQFLRRRHKAGRPVLKIFFIGDTDEDTGETDKETFENRPMAVLKDMFSGGVNLPWNLVLCIAIGLWLMTTRLTLGNNGALANWEHFAGSIVITIAISALAEVARPARFLIIPFAGILLVTPFVYGGGTLATANSLVCAGALIALSLPRGKISHAYGKWNRLLKY